MILGAHENGSQAPTAVEVSRVQEKDLPRRLRLHFANFEHDHEASEQSASRISTEAIDELDVELPISMEPDTAAQLAEIMLYAQWVGRNTYRFSLDNTGLTSSPPTASRSPSTARPSGSRILAVNYKIGGILEIDAQRDDDGSYVSTAVAMPSAPSGGLPGEHGNGPICPSEVVLLDIPCLRDSIVRDAGYYAAIYGLCPETWTCAELYRSNDGGATFGRVARTDRQATVGEIDDITGPPTDVALLGESPQYDESNSITVTLFTGTLSSITDAQIDAGFNAAAIGVDGRWVIIQYKTATLSTDNTWVLTDLIWGLQDTGHLLGTTVAGDTFVWLNDPALLRIPETPENIGVEKQFKVPTCGESLDAVDEFSFTTWGLCYQRLCPSTVISCSTTEPPDWRRRTAILLLAERHLADRSVGNARRGDRDLERRDRLVGVLYARRRHHRSLLRRRSGDDVIPPGGGGDPTPAPWPPASATYVTRATSAPPAEFAVAWSKATISSSSTTPAGRAATRSPSTARRVAARAIQRRRPDRA